MTTAKNNGHQYDSGNDRRASRRGNAEPALHLGGMSKRTHEGYLRAVRQLADYCKRSPDRITEDQLRAYILYLKNQRGFASGSLRIKNIKSLPEVLTIEQVHQIIDHCTTLRMAVYFWTVYSLGLRMNEGLNLQIGDIVIQSFSFRPTDEIIVMCHMLGAIRRRLSAAAWRRVSSAMQ